MPQLITENIKTHKNMKICPVLHKNQEYIQGYIKYWRWHQAINNTQFSF
jgi:hypothetical protein